MIFRGLFIVGGFLYLILGAVSTAFAAADDDCAQYLVQNALPTEEQLQRRVSKIKENRVHVKKIYSSSNKKGKERDPRLVQFDLDYPKWVSAVFDLDKWGLLEIENFSKETLRKRQIAFLINTSQGQNDQGAVQVIIGKILKFPGRELLGFKRDDGVELIEDAFLIETANGSEVYISCDVILDAKIHPGRYVEANGKEVLEAFEKKYESWFQVDLQGVESLHPGWPAIADIKNLVGRKIAVLHSEVGNSLKFFETLEGVVEVVPTHQRLGFGKEIENDFYQINTNDGKKVKLDPRHVRVMRVDVIGSGLLPAIYDFQTQYGEWDMIGTYLDVENYVGQKIAALIVDRANFDRYSIEQGKLVSFHNPDSLRFVSQVKDRGLLVLEKPDGSLVKIDSKLVFQMRVPAEKP